MLLYIYETFLVYKLETFKNCKELKNIMIIAMIYIFLCDISSTVENYFQKILSPAPPEKIQSPLFTQRPLS